jgi:hypothetical protein
MARSCKLSNDPFYETAREELYDMNPDAPERNDHAKANPARRKELSARLAE